MWACSFCGIGSVKGNGGEERKRSIFKVIGGKWGSNKRRFSGYYHQGGGGGGALIEMLVGGEKNSGRGGVRVRNVRGHTFCWVIIQQKCLFLSGYNPINVAAVNGDRM